MKINFFCPIWGITPNYIQKIDGDVEAIFEKVKKAGYDGVEMAIPVDDTQKHQIIDLKKYYQLEVIALQYAASGHKMSELLDSFKQHITSAADVNPVLINSHTGADYFSFEDNCELISESFTLEKGIGIKILHETHRGRFSFHSATTQQYLSKFPDLRLTADFSHWCNVSESFLTDQSENVLRAIERADHLHARVGHPQSCQVSDPRAPEWQNALNHHLSWWDQIIQLHKEANRSSFTITSEFGPGDYMPTLPFTQEPVASQWDINIWMKDLLKDRYSN